MAGQNRHERRKAAAKTPVDGRLDAAGYIATAGKFIDLANRINQKIIATDLQKAFIGAAARYNAHVAKAVLGVQDEEGYIREMTRSYETMLRQHMADPTLATARAGTAN